MKVNLVVLSKLSVCVAKCSHTWLWQAGRTGSWTVAGLRSGAAGTAAAAAGGGRKWRPSALHWAPASGPGGCTDGTLTFSPVVWALCSFCCGFYRWVAWAGFAAEHKTKKEHVKPQRAIWRIFDPCDWSQSSLWGITVNMVQSLQDLEVIFIALNVKVEHCSDTRWELPDEETGSGNLTLIVHPPAVTGYTWKLLGIRAVASMYETRNSSWAKQAHTLQLVKLIPLSYSKEGSVYFMLRW